VPQRGFKEAHILAVVNKGQNEGEKNILPQNKNKPRRKCRSVVSKMQGGIRFVQWRIWKRRIIRTRFWKSLSRNIAFFCFPFVFLLAASFSDSWLAVIEPRVLVAFGEILPSIAMKFIDFLLALFCFLSKDSSLFQSVSCWGNELVWKAWPQLLSVNKKMWSSWNGVFAAKSRWGVNDLWRLWHLGGLLTFIKKSLFVDNSRAFLYFT